MFEGFAYCKMFFDDRGRPIDFVDLHVNGPFGKLTGLANVVGQEIYRDYPRQRLAPRIAGEIRQVVVTGKPESFEIEIKALGIWFLISSFGMGKGCFGTTFENITERRQSEKTLRQAEEKYRVIFQSAGVGILRSTPAGRFITVNPAMAQMLGYDSPPELRSQYYRHFPALCRSLRPKRVDAPAQRARHGQELRLRGPPVQSSVHRRTRIEARGRSGKLKVVAFVAASC